LLESLRNAKDQNTPFQTREPKRAVGTTERQGTQLYTFRFGRARNGTRVQLWISYMHIVREPEKGTRVQSWIFCVHIVREPEKAPGSNYGFSVCILCESRKRHQGPFVDFLYAYCARAINRIWDLETRQSLLGLLQKVVAQSKYSRTVGDREV
jgi:hypothetical protein